MHRMSTTCIHHVQMVRWFCAKVQCVNRLTSTGLAGSLVRHTPSTEETMHRSHAPRCVSESKSQSCHRSTVSFQTELNPVLPDVHQPSCGTDWLSMCHLWREIMSNYGYLITHMYPLSTVHAWNSSSVTHSGLSAILVLPYDFVSRCYNLTCGCFSMWQRAVCDRYLMGAISSLVPRLPSFSGATWKKAV